MFARVRFNFWSSWAHGAAKHVEKTGKRGDTNQAISILKVVLWACDRALSIKSDKIIEEERENISNFRAATRRIEAKLIFSLASKDDREFIISILQFWSDTGVVIPGVSLVDQMTRMFDIAKDRLPINGKSSDALTLIYDGDHIPDHLRRIMKSFFAGEITRDEAEAQLDDCTKKLRKWLPELQLLDPSLPIV